MSINLKTNVDCCKPFMYDLQRVYVKNNVPVNSIVVGDDICVKTAWKGTRCTQIFLRVVKRSWDSEGDLTIELNLTETWNLRGFVEFEKFVNGCDYL